MFYIILFFVSLFSRKIFIVLLGNDLVGLNSTLQNILGILNLAELGVWSATAYSLYKYIHDKNHEKIKDVVTVFGYFYRVIGFIILGASLILAVFLPLIFKNSGVSIYLIIAAFFTFLYSSLLGFFFNFKQILVVADQKNYIIVTISNTILVIKVLMQILFLYLFAGNFYLWLALEIVFATVNTFFLNFYVAKYYPWLKLKKFNKELLQSHKILLRDIKRMISHKFAGVVVLQTDNLFIYIFAGLVQVTYYTNYTLLITRIVNLLNSMLNSGIASVGNLVSTDDKAKINKVFWELLSLRYVLGGVVVVSIFFLINSFIFIWLGKEYVISNVILLLILLNSYILITRYSVDNFIDSFGLFGHVWAPWTEAGLNLCITIIFGFKYGIIGILAGTSISTILIVCIWKPYYLFSHGFKKSVVNYWFNVFKHLGVLAITFFIIYLIDLGAEISAPSNYLQWLIRAVAVLAISFVLNFTLTYLTSSGLRSFTKRIIDMLQKKRA
ncbi:MAG: hypothetical protein ABI707_04025 [Ferruginibacter sp.]